MRMCRQLQTQLPQSREMAGDDESLLDDTLLYRDIEHAAQQELADGAALSAQLQRKPELAGDADFVELRRTHAANLRALVIASFYCDTGPGRTGDGPSLMLHDAESYAAAALCTVRSCTVQNCRGNACILLPPGDPSGAFKLAEPHWKSSRHVGGLRTTVKDTHRPVFVKLLRAYVEVRPLLGLTTFGDKLFAAPAGSVATVGGFGEDDSGQDDSSSGLGRGVSVRAAFDDVQRLAGNMVPQAVTQNLIRRTYATRCVQLRCDYLQWRLRPVHLSLSVYISISLSLSQSRYAFL